MKYYNYIKLTRYYVFIITCIIPLIFTPFSRNDAFYQPKFELWLISLVSVLVFIIIERIKTKERFRVDHNPEVYFILGIYLTAWGISTFFSHDKFVSITGLLLFNGLFQLFMCIFTFLIIIFFFTFRLSYFKYVLMAYCIVSVYCILQFYGSDPFLGLYGPSVRSYLGQTFATIGNQNQVSTCLSVVFVIAAFYYILAELGLKEKNLYLAAALIIFAGDVATKTRGGWLAIGFAFAVALPFILKNPIYFKRYISVCVACCFVFLAIDFTSGGVIFNRFLSIFYEGRSVAAGNFDGNLGSRRMEIWINSIDLIKKYWLFGSGPDTFALIYNNLGPGLKGFATRELTALTPHNESLRLLITTGIFSLAAYWAIVILVIKKGISVMKEDLLIAPFLLALVCYLVKGMLNCSTVTDMILFWVLLAVIYSYKSTIQNENNDLIYP